MEETDEPAKAADAENGVPMLREWGKQVHMYEKAWETADRRACIN